MTFLLLLAPPVLAAILAFSLRPYRAVVGWVNALLSLVSVGAAIWIWAGVLSDEVMTAGPGELLRADALSTLLAFCISLVGALAAWLGPGIGKSHYDAAQARRFRIFAHLFEMPSASTAGSRASMNQSDTSAAAAPLTASTTIAGRNGSAARGCSACASSGGSSERR